ncbi:hypothetical protein A3F08_02785 [Candidatus Berkelbacteria bacterium RIFCSPHIGHO2_12_FULL_36_9]|uniref:Uncharacterized protein n=1 Tax=Candidatus Berkelbacteria bacterium RIFCSPHIGHO2_12_FULL_36_9 TaxID=1797469 RepID=A0A1F5EDU7_9BACT|nr:MAG: hypothetical protein A3F08_02785 [Candidatus Berkelbacteria bacterium RIFCSPHIGHO2_12_FULL_36_9]
MVSTELKKIECPNCGNCNLEEKDGKINCEHCGSNFIIDKSDNLVAVNINNVICPNCHKSTENKSNFCQYCGKNVVIYCNVCNNAHVADVKYCPIHGTPIHLVGIFQTRAGLHIVNVNTLGHLADSLTFVTTDKLIISTQQELNETLKKYDEEKAKYEHRENINIIIMVVLGIPLFILMIYLLLRGPH